MFSFKRVVFLVFAVFISLSLAYCYNHRENYRQAMEAANRFALEEALNVLNLIKDGKQCPSEYNDWRAPSDPNSRHELMTWKGNEYFQIPIFLDCLEGSRFQITVSYSFDSAVFLSNKNSDEIEVVYGHFSEPSRIGYKSRSDLSKISEILLR